MCLAGSQGSALQQGQPDPSGPSCLFGGPAASEHESCETTAGEEWGAEGRIPPFGSVTAPEKCVMGKSALDLRLQLPWDLLGDKHPLDMG